MMDVVCSQLWNNMSPSARMTFYITSSYMRNPSCDSLNVDTIQGMERWSRRYLVSSWFYTTVPPDMRLVVPYIARAHWSLFILD